MHGGRQEQQAAREATGQPTLEDVRGERCTRGEGCAELPFCPDDTDEDDEGGAVVAPWRCTDLRDDTERDGLDFGGPPTTGGEVGGPAACGVGDGETRGDCFTDVVDAPSYPSLGLGARTDLATGHSIV